jgi:hypothetical protein
MNSEDFYQSFPKFSKSSVKLVDGELQLAGKNVLIAKIGNIFDVYVCDAKARIEGDFQALLTAMKVTYICKTLPKTMEIHKLDGEMWYQTDDLAWLNGWLWDNRKSLGLRKRGAVPVCAFKAK